MTSLDNDYGMNTKNNYCVVWTYMLNTCVILISQSSYVITFLALF